MRKLKVHSSGRYLMWDDESPFFYLGDTAWELFHRLTKEEADKYLSVRAAQGFNAIQAVALAELEGLTVPNKYGRFPFKFTNDTPDPLLPDTDGEYSYWDHVEYIIRTAEKKDLFITLLPTWGDKFNITWGKGPEIFTPENAYIYGKWIAEKFKKHWNIIWMLGGDRYLSTHRHQLIIDEMARGISEADSDHLITFHPGGGISSADELKGKDYIDFHTVQSGHDFNGYESYLFLQKMRETEQKPYMDSEPRYEDHPACFKAQYDCYWSAQDVRNNAYWNMCEGSCGHTYGNHCVWGFTEKTEKYYPYTWKEVLYHDGAEQIGFLKELRMKRSFFDFRPAPCLVEDETALGGHIAAGRGDDYAYIYTPLGQAFRANLELFGGNIIRSSWFNPRNGEETVFKLFPPKQVLFVPPTYCEDWVLVLEILE